MAASNFSVTAPVTAGEFSVLMDGLGYFEQAPTLAIGVSGGADSMALLLLADAWLKQRGGRLVALTVDHGLRPEAADEARQVHSWCETYTIEHHILEWKSPLLTSAIQEQARAARYRLLSDYCRQRHILHLLTAHHADDQAETLFFRLARGSGLDGLACMAAISFLPGVRLLRPLLAIEKSRLIETLRQRKMAWLEDPSNHNPLYSRSLIRQHLAASRNRHAITEQANALINRFSHIRNQQEQELASQLAQTVSCFPAGYAQVDKTAFSALPTESALRILASVIMTVSGHTHPPRQEKLRQFLQHWQQHTQNKCTMGGCLIENRGAHWLIYREFAAIEPPAEMYLHQTQRWDGRFLVSLNAALPHHTSYTLRALGRDGLHALCAATTALHFGIEKPVLPTLPSLWHLEQLVSVPHMAYTAPDYAALACHIRFNVAKPLAATAFFGLNNSYHRALTENP